MIEMSAPTDEVALETIELLESRLRRVQFLLTGDSDSVDAVRYQTNDSAKDQTVGSRLSKLELEFDRLCARSDTVKDIIKLRMLSSIFLIDPD